MANRDKQHDSPLLPQVVIVTDVHYWRRHTGAQQRIFALVEFLRQHSTELTTVFAAPLENSSASDDRAQITAAGLNVVSLIDDWRPEGWLERFQWELHCTVNGLLNLLNPIRKNKTLDRSPPSARRLADFRSPLLVRRWNALLKKLQPKIVIVEYVTLAYLVADQASRVDATYAVDTHDILSSRCEQFRDHGFDHWVELTAEEESAALRLFDLVIAIEAEEAVRFGELVDDQRLVVIAGHPVAGHVCPPATASDDVTVGYFASDNAANRHALAWFFENVWPEVHRKLPQVEFLIAGTIGETLRGEALPDQVTLLGSVDQPIDFYRAVDVVVNPIQFGTGLKIKNLEALAFGRPLVTTAHGGAGMSDSEFATLPCYISDSAEAMAAQLIQVCADGELRSRTSAESADFVSQQLTPEKVFGPLLKRLKNLIS